MARINENFLKLPGSYLFSETAKRKNTFLSTHPGIDVINMGIGDVTRPLAPSVVRAMHEAVDEMGNAATFHGYGPEQGYEFLREQIAAWDYRERGVAITADEIFVSDGAKSDCGNIGDIFAVDNVVAVCDPVYPAYVDTNAMAGRAGDFGQDGRWNRLVYLPCMAETGFVPAIPQTHVDLIYLCFPNNPTGAMATREQLRDWVDYAREHEAVILYDSAYEAFIRTPGLPHTIYEMEGADECAIEFRSFSKTAGFTGTRCAYTVVPSKLMRGGVSLRDLWNRRQSTKFNGVPYVVQRGAAAIYTEQGRQEVRETIDFYLQNAATILHGLRSAGIQVSGGENAPYIWMKAPDGMDSWALFDKLLQEAHIVCTPGVGFGPCGEGYIRLTAFGTAEDAAEGVRRITAVLE